MIGKRERSKEINRQLKKDPRVEKELSEAINTILGKHKIGVKDDELLVFVPAVLARPKVIWEALDPCRMGICPPDWISIKESVSEIFSVGRLETFRKTLGR